MDNEVSQEILTVCYKVCKFYSTREHLTEEDRLLLKDVAEKLETLVMSMSC